MNQHRRRQGKSLPDGKPVAIEEKPAQPKSPFAITGLYFFDPSIASISRDLHPSDRDELEIVDNHRRYMERGELEVVELGRGIAWLDMGTPDSLLAAANLIKAIDDRQGYENRVRGGNSLAPGLDRRRAGSNVGGGASGFQIWRLSQ
jgi:dTDP-glucose pyrophosphorylase